MLHGVVQGKRGILLCLFNHLYLTQRKEAPQVVVEKVQRQYHLSPVLVLVLAGCGEREVPIKESGAGAWQGGGGGSAAGE